MGMGIRTGMGTEMGDGDRNGTADRNGDEDGEMGSRTETGTTSGGFSAEFAAFGRAAPLAVLWAHTQKLGMFSMAQLGWQQPPGAGGVTAAGGSGSVPQAELRGVGGLPARPGGLPAPPAGKRLRCPPRGTARAGTVAERGWGTWACCGKPGGIQGLEGREGTCRASPAPPTPRRGGLGRPGPCCDMSPKGVT